ncbi:MAG: ABC transporter substrate-binding protein [Candidatus Dormibacteria bacterium]|jgi:peptide/nickel transport system substrate-binding protein
MSVESSEQGGEARRGWGAKLPHRLWVVVGLAAIGAAACGSTSSSTTGAAVANINPTTWNTSTVSWLTKNVNDTGTPPSTPTGTLSLAGSTDVSGMLDPQGEYDTIGYSVLLTMDRTLVGYEPSSNFNAATSVVDDAASSYTVSNGGATYTFHLRSGLRWAVTDPTTGAPVAPDDGTAVTSQDFELGLERECDPTLSAYGNPSYYTSTIQGYSTFCSGFEALPATATPAQRAAYIQANPISGLSTPDSQTLVINLTSPAVDFPNIMSMFFAAAAPPSALNYTPLTAGNPIWSDGPYEVQTYTPGQKIVLVPNPYWGATSGTNTTATSWSADPIHHRYVAEISINETLGSDAAADEVQQEIQANTLDLEWNTTVPASSLPSLANYTNPLFGSFPSPGITNPYLVFNLQADTPLKNVAVRQALEYAINKVAMAKIYGGSDFNVPLNQVFGPGAEGYIAGYDPYPTANNEGDAAKCKSLLKAAGYGSGFTITDFYRTDGNHPAVFQEVQKDFGACGVTVNGKGISQGYYTATGILQTSASALASSGWDITEPGWVPDWYGPASARSILPDLFGSSDFPGTNWGDFSNSTVDSLITKAESASTLAASTADWQAANKAVMAQAPFIPFMGQLTNLMHSSSVHNALYNPFSAQYNLADIWLS